MNRNRLAVGTLGALLVLTGCSGGDDGGDGGTADSGFADQSAEEIVEASKEAMHGLDSLRLSGDLTNDGQEINLDLAVDKSGNCVGSIGVDGGTAEIVSQDGSTWFRPDEAFWRSAMGEQGEALLGLVGDKWVLLGEDDDSFAEFCDLDELLEQMLDSSSDSTYEKLEVEDVDGEDALAVRRSNEEDGDSIGYVRLEGEHYLVRIEREGEDSGLVEFSGFDEEVAPEAPADDEVIDLDSLGG